jgi:hypothetical protein
MLKFVTKHPFSKKNLYILYLDDLTLNIDLSKMRYFIALLVENINNINLESVNTFITKLLDDGMVYLCTWGKNCELIHDITDEIMSIPGNSSKYLIDDSNDDTIMTTWHKNEKMEEALWYTLYNAYPTNGFFDSTENIIIMVIDDKDLQEKVYKYLNNLNSLNENVLRYSDKNGD